MKNDLLNRLFRDNLHAFQGFLKKRFYQLNEYDVEDVIQLTFTKLLYKGDQLLDVSNLTAYTYTSLQNTAKDYFKKESRISLYEELDGEEKRSPEEVFMQKELGEEMEKAINALPPKMRFVFIETEIKGRSYQELVEETGEKLGTLLARKSRARHKLQAYLQDYLGGKDDVKK